MGSRPAPHFALKSFTAELVLRGGDDDDGLCGDDDGANARRSDANRIETRQLVPQNLREPPFARIPKLARTPKLQVRTTSSWPFFPH
jgi:hypothetical protein